MFDWFKSAPKRPAAMQTDGPTAANLRREFSSHPSRGLTPARLAQILLQAEYGDLTAQADLFQDMEEKDGHLAAEMAKRKLAVTQLEWHLTPPRDAAAREKKAAQRLEDLIRDRIPFGWIPHIHPARSGYLPRVGLHRVLAWPYLYKNYSVRDLAEFLEVYGLPIRLGKYPAGTDAAARQTLLDAVLAIGHHAAGIIPDSMAVEIVNAMAQGSADGFRTMIDWCEATQSKAILGGTLTSQTGANGNRSLGDVHNEVRMDIRNDDAQKLDRSLSDYLIYPVAVLNGMANPDRCPRFTSDIQEPDELALYADAMPKLAGIGFRIPASYVHGKLRIPEPEGDEPILSAAPAAPPANPTAPPPVASPSAALSAANPDPDPTPVSAHTDQLAQAAAPAMDALIARVRQLVDQAGSLPELRDRLLMAYGDLDATELTNVMALAYACADLAGRYDAREERP